MVLEAIFDLDLIKDPSSFNCPGKIVVIQGKNLVVLDKYYNLHLVLREGQVSLG